MTEIYFERRDYPEGVQYIQVNEMLPGNLYFVKRVDENDKIYYAPVQPKQSLAQIYQQDEIPQPGCVCCEQDQKPKNGEIEQARSLHFGITITALFIPTIIYLIGFPFVFVRIRNLVNKLTNNNPGSVKLNSFTGVGWTCWVMHFIFLITLCVGFIPQQYCYPGYTQMECLDQDGYYEDNLCCIWDISIGGVTSVGVFGFFTVAFDIAIISVGAVLLDNLTKINSQVGRILPRPQNGGNHDDDNQQHPLSADGRHSPDGNGFPSGKTSP